MKRSQNYTYKKWTPTELKYLKEHGHNKPTWEIAEELHRTQGSVRRKMRRINLFGKNSSTLTIEESHFFNSWLLEEMRKLETDQITIHKQK